jgi:hypothetical protein
MSETRPDVPVDGLFIGRVSTGLLRVRLAKALHDADCGCKDFGDPLTDEDDRYIKAVDEALATMVREA